MDNRALIESMMLSSSSMLSQLSESLDVTEPVKNDDDDDDDEDTKSGNGGQLMTCM